MWMGLREGQSVTRFANNVREVNHLLTHLRRELSRRGGELHARFWRAMRSEGQWGDALLFEIEREVGALPHTHLWLARLERLKWLVSEVEAAMVSAPVRTGDLIWNCCAREDGEHVGMACLWGAGRGELSVLDVRAAREDRPIDLFGDISSLGHHDPIDALARQACPQRGDDHGITRLSRPEAPSQLHQVLRSDALTVERLVLQKGQKEVIPGSAHVSLLYVSCGSVQYTEPSSSRTIETGYGATMRPHQRPRRVEAHETTELLIIS